MKKRRLVVLTVSVLILIYFTVTFTFGDTGLLRYFALLNKKNQLVQEIGTIESHNSRLKTEVKQLKENPFYLEKHAREDFGLAKPDEYVFKYDR